MNNEEKSQEEPAAPVRQGERRGRMVSMRLSNEDLQRATELALKIGGPVERVHTRTEVIKRALHLLYWAFVNKDGDELIVRKNGREIGRLQWSDIPEKKT